MIAESRPVVTLLPVPTVPVARVEPASQTGDLLRWTAAYGLVLTGLGMAVAHTVAAHGSSLVFYAAVLLMTGPTAYTVLSLPLSDRRQRGLGLGLVLLSGLFVRYAFALTNPFLVGTDAPYHYFQASRVAQGVWPFGHSISQALPALYLLYGGVARLTSVSLNYLVLWLPPLVNLGTAWLFYLYLSRLTSARIALVATYIYVWEYTSFFFGFEFRTQGLALAFFAGFLALRTRRFGGYGSATAAALGALLLLGIALSSLVASLLASLMLLAMGAGERLIGGPHRRSVSWSAPALVVIATVAYVIYGSHAWNTFVPYLWSVLRNTLALERVNDAQMQGVYVAGYGLFVTALQWLIRIVFVAGLGLAIHAAIKGRGRNAGTLAATVTLLVLIIVATPLGSELSPGRYWQFLAPFFGLYTADALFGLRELVTSRARRLRFRLMPVNMVFAAVLALWAVSGAMKLPAGLTSADWQTHPIAYRLDYSYMPVVQRAVDYRGAAAYYCADVAGGSMVYALAGIGAHPISNGATARTCIDSGRHGSSGRSTILLWQRQITPIPQRVVRSLHLRLLAQAGSMVAYVVETQ